MRRFTILGLMGLVLGVAVAVAALRNADDYWAGGLLVATALLIGMAVLGAVYHSGRRRAARLGFAVFAGGYFALAFLGLSAENRAKLPTTWLLSYVHNLVAPSPTYIVKLAAKSPPYPTVMIGSNGTAGLSANTVTTPAPYQATLTNNASVRTPARWNWLLPGAANYEAFSVVGHCLFALLAGLLGTGLALRYQAKQARLHDQVG
jgi:hypothetical protein